MTKTRVEKSSDRRAGSHGWEATCRVWHGDVSDVALGELREVKRGCGGEVEVRG